MRREEEQNQVALASWFRVQHPEYRDLITIPSFGENLGPRRMKRLKQMGLTPGWPDIFIAVPKHEEVEVLSYGQYGPRRIKETKQAGGLFIEMKSESGRLESHQAKVHNSLRGQGYKVVVCHNWDDARNIIKEYLSGGVKP